jgi:hypothetical protein
MEADAIVRAIKVEIDILKQVRALLTDQKQGAPKRRKMSAEGRARIAAAQRARWAKAKKLDCGNPSIGAI